MNARGLAALAAAVLFASAGIAQRVDLAAGSAARSTGRDPDRRAVHSADPTPEEVATRLSQTGLRQLGAYTTLARLLSVGPRLTGSAQADAAVRLMAEHMTALGFDNVRTEPTTVSHWVRGDVQEGRILPGTAAAIPVKIRAIGNSIGTPAAGLTANVVEVRSVAELATVGDRVRGKIVFFNGAMDPTLLDTFPAYGGAAQQRSGGAVAAAKAGAIGAVVRSLTLELDDDPHTGTMSYDAATLKIPAVTISTGAAERLSALLRKDPGTRFFFKTSCRTLPPVVSHNVMGELRGSEHPEEVIVVGGHIDSWDLSPGAHDDGSGCAQSIEALRLIRELGLKPRRTIRAVLYMDEENGGTGGRDYARADARKAERHIAAIESDRGGFLPLGFGVGGKGETYARIQAWEPLFQRIGLQWIRPGGGGVDIGPLGESGTVLMSLVPDSQRYFDVHHSGTDTLDKVHPRELQLGANAMALLAWLVAEDGIVQSGRVPETAIHVARER
jgi:carboxypeptidase Q